MIRSFVSEAHFGFKAYQQCLETFGAEVGDAVKHPTAQDKSLKDLPSSKANNVLFRSLSDGYLNYFDNEAISVKSFFTQIEC